jgi:hypothetical protein
MRLITSRRPGSCLALALASCLDLSDAETDSLITRYACDKIVRPRCSAPLCYKGMHPNELALAALDHGYACVTFERVIHVGTCDDDAISYYLCLREHIQGRMGILLMPGHAVAWDGEQIYDSRGYITTLADQEIHTFYQIIRLPIIS